MLDLFRGGGPGRGEADDGVGGVVGFPDIEADFRGEGFHVVVFQDYKLLIGRCFKEEGNPFFLQHGNHFLRPVDGVRSDAAVEVVRKEGVELDAQQAALRQEGAMLFDGGEEVLRGFLRENDSFTAQGTDLGAADVEDVAEVFHVRQGEVAGGTGEGIAEAGTVDEQRQAVLVGDALDFSKF